MQHVYIHFPYCLYKCHYCDFNSYAVEKGDLSESRYIEALLKEIRESDLTDKPIATVFFGGGTPSLMSADAVQKILTTLAQKTNFTPNTEITLEANPGTITRDKMIDFKQAGITRLSIGVQSLAKKNLERFGRIHTGDEALTALKAALDVGFAGVSADLIYGFPDQTLDEWTSDLTQVAGLNLTHMSCYALTAEEGTSYTRDLRQKKFAAPDTDLVAAMQQATYKILTRQNLNAYEISNFAKDGFESRHNLAYWHYRSYTGFGAGAWSMRHRSKVEGRKSKVERRENFKLPDKYIAAIQSGETHNRREVISDQDARREFLMMGLRLAEGVSFESYSNFFHEDLSVTFGQAIETAVNRGLVTVAQTRLKPTFAGFMLNHELVGLFF